MVLSSLALAGPAIGVTTAPQATACGPGEDVSVLCPNQKRYIDQLASIGITPTTSLRALSNAGNQTCGALIQARHANPSPAAAPGIKDGVAGMLRHGNSSLTEAQADGWVQAAVDNLCPDSATGLDLE